MKLTLKKALGYVRNDGNSCPHCGTIDDIQAQRVELPHVWIHCVKCNAEWVEIWKLVGVSDGKADFILDPVGELIAAYETLRAEALTAFNGAINHFGSWQSKDNLYQPLHSMRESVAKWKGNQRLARLKRRFVMPEEANNDESRDAVEDALRAMLNAVNWDDVVEVGGEPLAQAVHQANQALGIE